MELQNLVMKYQKHNHGKYCQRPKKTKSGKFTKNCKSGFPRKMTSEMILNDVVVAILARMSSDMKKRLYHIPRKQEEVYINDYNPILLHL